MKNFLWTLSLVAVSGGASAVDFTDVAEVISSVPIYERITQPQLDCWTESTSTPGTGASVGSKVVGGVAGAAIGSQIGDGVGKKLATVAGAVMGVEAMDRSAQRDHSQTQTIQHCREIKSSYEMLTGYKVVYRYKGQDITTMLPYQPTDKVRIGIRVIEDVR